MKKKFLLAVCIFISQWFQVSAQQPVKVWHHKFGGTRTEWSGHGAVSASNGNRSVWVGTTFSNNEDVPGNNSQPISGSDGCPGYLGDVFVVRHSISGEIIWAHNFGGYDHDSGYAIKQTGDTGYIVVGTTESDDQDVSQNDGGISGWVLKLGTGGNISWEKTYFSPGTTLLKCVDVLPDGYLIGGVSDASDSENSESFVMKISTNGDEVWQTPIGSGITYAGASIEATSDGGCIFSSYHDVVKLDEDGDVEWTQSEHKSVCVIEANDGGFVAAGNGEIFKLNNSGQLLWLLDLNPDGDNGFGVWEYDVTSVIRCQSGGYVAAINAEGDDDEGSTLGETSSIIHITEDGIRDWEIPVNLGNVHIDSLVELEDGTIIAGGTTLGNSNGTSTDQNGVVVRFEWPTLATAPLASSDTDVCAGETIEINADAANGWFPPYEIQLSDASGDFSNPVVLLVTSEELNECTIPIDTPSGDGYRIRFVSLDTGQIGEDNGENISIHVFINPKFSESMGSVTSNTTIDAHEAADGFHQDGFTMSGTGTVSNTNPSNGYENATGAANIFLGNSGSNTFIISDINTNGDDLEYLQFGMYATSLLAGVQVAVSTDGTSYTNLTFLAPISGWGFVTATGNIPQTSNLRIRFTRSGILNGDVRIDDVKLIHDPTNPQITANEPMAFCGPGSITLVAPAATSHLWSTGAITQTISVSTTGDYTCLIGSANGCDITIGPVHVQSTAINYYTDADDDGYGDSASATLLCAPDDTHTITTGGDCDDQNPAVYDDATEICDGVDNDCDGNVDESLDADHDGYTICEGDCDDSNTAVNPGMMESNNDVDDNCNGTVDESYYYLETYYLDSDGDLYGDPLHPFVDNSLPEGCVTNFLDCDDNDPEVYASAEEICGDGKDNNCDGIVDNCVCVGDMDGNGAVNVGDLLIFTSVFGNVCN